MRIKDISKWERPRERLKQKGVEAGSDINIFINQLF